MIEPPAETRLCCDCLEVKPSTEFRRRLRTGQARLGQCRACHNLAERLRRAQRRRAWRDQRVAAFVTQLKNARSDNHVRLLCNLMLYRFGGLQGFVNAWLQQLGRVQRDQPGSKKSLDFFQAVVRMIEFSDSTRPNVTGLTDEDLQRELEAETRRLIDAHPELAVQAAGQIGWTIIPPDAVDHGESASDSEPIDRSG
jgi:hypothetical protein